MWTCKYCQKQLELKNKYTKSGHLARCTDWLEWKKKNLTEEFLIKEYVDRKKSIPQISEESGLESYSTINRLLRSYNIKRRSISKSRKLPNAKLRYQRGCLESFGSTHNFNSGSVSRTEMIERLESTEGISNVFQRDSVKQKSRETKIKKYGTDNLWTLKWYRDKIFQSVVFSSIHKKVCDFLLENNIKFEIEYSINRIEENTKKYLYDIKLSNDKLIEVNGDYWHANPLKFKPHDIFHFPRGIKSASDIWEEDALKIKTAINAGYKVLVIWENDINHNWNEVADRILTYNTDNED